MTLAWAVALGWRIPQKNLYPDRVWSPRHSLFNINQYVLERCGDEGKTCNGCVLEVYQEDSKYDSGAKDGDVWAQMSIKNKKEGDYCESK